VGRSVTRDDGDGGLGSLAQIGGLDDATLARVDILASLHGISREAMLVTLLVVGSTEAAANDGALA
jgi:hypothetical protein